MTFSLRKRPMPLHALDVDDLNLDFAHRWWHGRRRGGLLPARSAVDTPEFRLLVRDAGWIEVADDAAEHWSLGPLAGLLAGLPVDRAAALAAALRPDLEAIRFTGAVLVQELTLTGPGIHLVRRQLVLPHADDGTRVRDLLVVLGERRPVRAAGSLSG